MIEKAKHSCDDTNSPRNITSPYKDADTTVLDTSLTDVWHLERTAKNVGAASTLKGCAEAKAD